VGVLHPSAFERSGVEHTHFAPSKAEGHQHHMWQSLRTNDIQMVSTDHCPFCMKGQKDMGVGDFSKIPNGIGSVEHRMDLMYQGVVSGQISLPRWVELTSTTPARMFGMYGRKGVIQPGADGDVVVYDPNGHTSIGSYVGTKGDGKYIPRGLSQYLI
jgi:dihydropyrimidinase